MPVTELVLLPFKQDEETQKTFYSTFLPGLIELIGNSPGATSRHAGVMLSCNGVDVTSEFRPVMGVGWEKVEDFTAAVSSPAFQELKPVFISLVTEPKLPQLYDTDVAPKAVYESALTEVFRVVIGEDEKKEASVKEAWAEFVKSIGAEISLSGVSINVEERTFLGMLGWETEEAREKAGASEKVKALRHKLGELDKGAAREFLVEVVVISSQSLIGANFHKMCLLRNSKAMSMNRIEPILAL